MAAANSAHVCTSSPTAQAIAVRFGTLELPAKETKVSKLTVHIDASALRAMLDTEVAKLCAEATVLNTQVIPPEAEYTEFNDGAFFRGRSNSDHDYWFTRRECPKGWGIPGSPKWHSSHWYGVLTRLDAQGRSWDHCTGPHVVGDFGFLVPVESV